MHGNVREMTLDRYKDYSRGIAIDPWIKNGGERVERGGSWNNDYVYFKVF